VDAPIKRGGGDPRLYKLHLFYFIIQLVHQYIKNVKIKNKNDYSLTTRCFNSKNDVSQIKHRNGSKIILNMQQLLNHVNFIKLRN